MYLFFKSLIIVFFATFRAGISERILSTFVKANRLPFISEVTQQVRNYLDLNFHKG